MFEDLKRNIEQEKKIILDVNSIQVSMKTDKANKKFYVSCLNSLIYQLQLLNKTVPDLLKEWSPLKKFMGEGDVRTEVEGVKLVGLPEKSNIVKMSYVSPVTKEKKYITINKEDKQRFLENLKLSEKIFQGLSKMKKKEERVDERSILKPNFYARYSNKYFLKYSEKISPQFAHLGQDLKKSNMRFMLKTYLSMAMFSAVLAFIGGFLLYFTLIFISLSNIIHIWIPFVAVGVVIFGFYTYPGSEADSVQKKISQELPFVTIHMAAIAGSNIEPTKIFRIIAFSKEYPIIGMEVRKVISQTEIYGYDLVTSLKNVAVRTSSKELSELFSGLATNISSGGELKNYLEKKSENFLLDYKLERQKYAELAGTFMDVYISILIAAPLVLMMMFIVMNVAGLGLAGIGITTLLFLSIAGIAVANVIFLIVLNLKQPAV